MIIQKDTLAIQSAYSGSLVPKISPVGRDLVDWLGWLEFSILQQRLDVIGHMRLR